MTILDPAAAMALLVAVSVAAIVGIALVATVAVHTLITRRPARPTAVRKPATGYASNLVTSH